MVFLTDSGHFAVWFMVVKLIISLESAESV